VLFASFVILHLFPDLRFALPEIIQVGTKRPECSGLLLMCRVPNFDGAKDGADFKGFCIITLVINKDFLEIDDATIWHSANVTGL
jgi:hypothetical protein